MISSYCHAFADADPIRYQSTGFDGAPATYGHFVCDDCLGDCAAVGYAGIVPNVCAVDFDISANLTMPSDDTVGNDALLAYAGTPPDDCFSSDDAIACEYDALLLVGIALL